MGLGNPFKKLEREIKKGINRLGDQVKGQINKLGNDVKGQVNSVGNQVKGQVNSVGNQVESGLRDVGQEMEKGLNATGETVEQNLKNIGKEIEEDFTEELPELLEEELKKAIATLAEAVTKGGLKKVRSVVHTTHGKLAELEKNKPELVDEINNLGGYIEIGPVKLNYEGFYTRMEQVSGVLDTYINNPPKFRRKPLLDMILALGPTSVDMGLSIQVMALVVGSKEIGIGGGIGDIRLKLFTELGDIVLEKIGVPE